MKSPYPADLCLFPPLKSEVIDTCGEKCKSTVTIIHDMSSDMHGRQDLIDKLSKDHKVLVFNNRGHYNITYDHGNAIREEDDGTFGFTSYIPDPGKCKKENGIDAYTTDMFVEDTRRILDQHEIKQTDLVGFSLGNFITLAFASKYPERVRKIAIGKGFTKYHDYIESAEKLMTGKPFEVGYWFWCTSRPKFNNEREYGCNVPMPVADALARIVFTTDTTKDQLSITAPSMVINCNDDLIIGSPVDKIENETNVKMDWCGHFINGKNDEMYDKIVNFLKD